MEKTITGLTEGQNKLACYIISRIVELGKQHHKLGKFLDEYNNTIEGDVLDTWDLSQVTRYLSEKTWIQAYSNTSKGYYEYSYGVTRYTKERLQLENIFITHHKSKIRRELLWEKEKEISELEKMVNSTE